MIINNSVSADDYTTRAERIQLLSDNIDTFAVEIGVSGARLADAQNADAEWLDELRAEGVPMFTYDEMMARRKEALIANVRANKQAKEIAGFNDDPEKMMPVENRPSVVSKHINTLTGDVEFARHDGTYYDMQGNVISEDAVVIFESTITTNENPQKDLGESTTGNRSKTE